MKKYLLIILFSLIALPAMAHKFNVSAGPIWNNMDAQSKCPGVCAGRRARWTGQWKTVRFGTNSICECRRHRHHRRYRRCWNRNYSAGPIWNNYDARGKCPRLCRSLGGRWNGQWTTVAVGRNSICTCRFCRRPRW